MWKVKRMNTARIVVLTIAVGGGGIAAYPADGSGNALPPTASINVFRDGVSDPTTIQK
jgi:pilus assembly protein CpaB